MGWIHYDDLLLLYDTKLSFSRAVYIFLM